jgi:hypothetical protein
MLSDSITFGLKSRQCLESGGYSPLTAEPGFDARPVGLGFAGHKVAPGQVFLGLRKFFPACKIAAMFRVHILMHILPTL